MMSASNVDHPILSSVTKKWYDSRLTRQSSDQAMRENHDKRRWNAELRDEILFRQPQSTHLGDCPICYLPFLCSSDVDLKPCCSKLICNGCSLANLCRERKEGLEHKCPFCRHPEIDSFEECVKLITKRVEMNDPIALCLMGHQRYNEGEYDLAFKYWTKAAEAGDAKSQYRLSILYRHGLGVEKNEEMKLYYLEEAAIAGHLDARYNLGCCEAKNGRIDRAVKHWIIAANLGHDESMQVLKLFYKRGHVSKEDFASARLAHQAAVDCTRSPHREASKSVEYKIIYV